MSIEDDSVVLNELALAGSARLPPDITPLDGLGVQSGDPNLASAIAHAHVTPELRQALLAAVEDVARLDSGTQQVMTGARVKAAGSSPVMSDPVTIMTVAGVLLLLVATAVDVRRDKAGQWTVEIKKPGLSSGALGRLFALILPGSSVVAGSGGSVQERNPEGPVDGSGSGKG